ncbi:MAG: archaeosortase/exosortase family protein [Armatimonadetes bacterium]|nr:archaeosortase/exosortase family protein [Armatimonadota bacterium]
MAFWPIWAWYAVRMQDGSDEPWGLLGLATLVFFLASEGRRQEGSLLYPTLFTLAYALGLPFLPPLLSAGLAVTAMAATVSRVRFGMGLHPGVWGLALLSLPLLSSLQFYLGYPLRVATGEGAALMVRWAGFPVECVGTVLSWAGRTVAVDAPCSGVRMLWGALYLTFSLACFCDWKPRRMLAGAVFAVAAVLLGNVFRSASLFFLEVGVLRFPAWVHQGTGLVVFAAVAAAIVWFGSRR